MVDEEEDVEDDRDGRIVGVFVIVRYESVVVLV